MSEQDRLRDTIAHAVAQHDKVGITVDLILAAIAADPTWRLVRTCDKCRGDGDIAHPIPGITNDWKIVHCNVCDGSGEIVWQADATDGT